MTRWLVTGAGGMLGTDLVAALTARGELVTGMDRGVTYFACSGGTLAK